MSLLLFLGQFFMWALLTLLSGFVGGVGLAAGFHVFKTTKEWLSKKQTLKDSKSYLDTLEAQIIGGAATQES